MRVIMNKEIRVEIMLSTDRYIIMEYVSRQVKEFRLAEMYDLLKKQDSQKWKAKEVKISLEWLADMGLGAGMAVLPAMF